MNEDRNIHIDKPQQEAGGLASVINSARHVFSQVGVVEGTKTVLQVNQFRGFDCPGCAWPDPDDHRSIVEFCENGAKAIAEEATTERCDPSFFATYPVREMNQWTDYQIGKSGRITEPMVLREGSAFYEPISWSDAFSLIGDKLQSLPNPNQAVFYTSGRTSNEAAFLYQLFVRKYGTNNLPDCSNMCHESSGVALTETVGIGKGSVKLEDFYLADVIVVMGQNPGTNHPRMLTALQKAKANGAKVISINPLPEAGLIGFRHPQNPMELIGKATAITDLWLPVRINEDVALLKAIEKLLFEKEASQPNRVLDHRFIGENTVGFDDFRSELEQHRLETLVDRCGVSMADVREAAELLAGTSKIIVCWAMGLTQHKNAVDTIREIVNLLLLKGSIGKPGAGTCPVRGHSNVQGDRTMGIYERPRKEFLDSLERNFSFAPPREPGFDTVETIQAMAQGRVKVFVAMGGNFLSAAPDTDFTADALRQCDLTVQISTKLNRSHLVTGKFALILPCLGRTELDVQLGRRQLVSVENSTGVVHQSLGSKKPASEYLLSEVQIVAQMASSTLPNDSLPWAKLAFDYDQIRDLIEKTIPGFDNYNQRIRKDGGFYLPNGARERNFKTETGKAHFTVNQMENHALRPGEFLMMTIRSHDQYNTTIYGLNDRYRGIYQGRRIILMNEKDIQESGFARDECVDLVSEYDGTVRVATDFRVVAYPIPKGNVATYFPEANNLIPHNHFARGSQTPISKSTVIRLRRHS